MVGRRRRAVRVRTATLVALRVRASELERSLRALEGGADVRHSQVKRWGNVAQDLAADLDALLAP